MAQSGMSVPTYAYAANNPLRYVDRNGLYFSGVTPQILATLIRLKANPNIRPYIEQMARSDKEIAFTELSCGELAKHGGANTYNDSTGWNVDYNAYLAEFTVWTGFGVHQTFDQMIAHELGHISGAMFEDLHGDDNLDRALDWENSVGPRPPHRPAHDLIDNMCRPKPPMCR